MNQEKIGEFLSKLRKENNLTQEELSEKLNVNVKSISRWENGKNMPDHSIIIEICKLYKISIDEFYKGEKIKKTYKIRKLIIFYLVVSFTGIFILPFLGISCPTFIVCSILIPIASLIDFLSLIFTGNDIKQISFGICNITLNPIVSFPISLLISIILFTLGILCWKVLIKYIKYISKKKNELNLFL